LGFVGYLYFYLLFCIAYLLARSGFLLLYNSSTLIIIIILPDRNLEPHFGNLPYPEKVPGTTRLDLGKFYKIDLKKNDIFTFYETIYGN
jgi:hypothetical protein